MSKIFNCQVCSRSFPVGPGCRGKYCSPGCSATGIKNRYQEIAQQQKIEKEKVYLHNPNYCANCSAVLSYDQRKNKFCSQRCSATLTGKGKIRSDVTKQKIAETLKNKNIGIIKPRKSTGICKVCANQVFQHRKTCSKECHRQLLSTIQTHYVKTERKKYALNYGQKSWMERTFEDWLLSHGLQKGIKGFLDEVHFKYKTENKTKNGWADFVFPKLHLIIELDGSHHLKRKELDAIRDAHLLNERGYTVIRITYAEYKKGVRKDEIKRLLNLL
jgi:very-short-patch-repair endonuclease